MKLFTGLDIFLSSTIIISLISIASSGKNDKSRPNVVLLLADDLGYGDLGCYGNAKVSTPNIDSLATEGMLFTRMYSQPVCSPARAAILTGSYPVHYGLMGDFLALFGVKWSVFRSHAQPGGINCEMNNLLPHLFKFQNYTSAFMGKWHLGMGRENEHLPRSCGFNQFYGTPGSHCAGCAGDERYRLTDHDVFVRIISSHVPAISVAISFILSGIYMGYLGRRTVIISFFIFCMWILLLRGFLFLTYDNPISCIFMRNEEIIEQPYKDENMTLRMTNEALAFMSDSVSVAKSPFFLYMAYLQPHVPSFRSKHFVNKSTSIYYDSVVEVDWSVGRILKHLQDLGVREETLVIFASDNGPELINSVIPELNPTEMHGSTLYTDPVSKRTVQLRGEKGSVWEGGVRVPAVISWPGHTQPGSQSHAISSLMDIFPTVMDIFDIGKMNRVLDGKSLMPLFSNPGQNSNHKMLLHFCDMNSIGAVSYGDFKVHYTTGLTNNSCTGIMLQPPLLFNVVDDPGETTPLPVNQNERLLNEIHIEVIKHQTFLLSKSTPQSSHFSRIPRPWLFPCANFPFCQALISGEDNYEHLFL